MKHQWIKLENWLKSNNPALHADLNPPANDADIQELERKFGTKLPEDFIACLKVHNGQKGQADWLFSNSEFLSSQRIIDEWAIWKDLLDGGDFDDAMAEPDIGIQPLWWSPKWIPFTYNGAGDNLCLDLDPAYGGLHGQIITVWHDNNARKKKFDSFSQWFTDFVDQTI